jgi:hypothetical protein
MVRRRAESMGLPRDAIQAVQSDCTRGTLLSTLAGAIFSFLEHAGTYSLFRATSRSDLFNCHAYLAEAFLKESLSLVSQPPTTLDLR